MMDFLTLRQALRTMLAQTNADIRAEKADIREINRKRGSTPWPGFLKARASLLCATLSHLRGRVHMTRWHTYGGGCSLCCGIEVANQASFIAAFLQHPCRGGARFFSYDEASLIRYALQLSEQWRANKGDVSVVTLTQ